MRNRRAVRIALVVLLGLVFVSATGTAYRYFIEHWSNSLRGPLIAASVAGILFIMIAPTLVRQADTPR